MSVLKGYIKATNYGDYIDSMLNFTDDDCKGTWYKKSTGSTRACYQCFLYELWDMLGIKKADTDSNGDLVVYAPNNYTAEQLNRKFANLREFLKESWGYDIRVRKADSKTITVEVE